MKRPTREEVEEILFLKAKLPLVVELAEAYLAALDVVEAAREEHEGLPGNCNGVRNGCLTCRALRKFDEEE